MRKQTLPLQKKLEDFSDQETLSDNQLKQIKGGDDPVGEGGEIVVHEDVIEV